MTNSTIADPVASIRKSLTEIVEDLYELQSFANEVDGLLTPETVVEFRIAMAENLRKTQVEIRHLREHHEAMLKEKMV